MIEVRHAAAGDLPRLVAWMLAFFDHLREGGDPYFDGAVLAPDDARATFETALAKGDLVLVAECDGRPVGYALGTLAAPFVRESPIRKIGHVSHCYVEPGSRGRGIARHLIAAAESWFRRKGARYVELNYQISNGAAAAVWPRLGYAPLRLTGRKDLDAES